MTSLFPIEHFTVTNGVDTFRMMSMLHVQAGAAAFGPAACLAETSSDVTEFIITAGSTGYGWAGAQLPQSGFPCPTTAIILQYRGSPIQAVPSLSTRNKNKKSRRPSTSSTRTA